ncbi:MAG UNVERIFIED_CONTAM: DUF1549 domain-containing protein [Planctomycetaceae bacterium]|jgi:hypothetical protein
MLSAGLMSQALAQSAPDSATGEPGIRAGPGESTSGPAGQASRYRRLADAEYLRRVSLDLIGMPPSADEARAFLADTDPAKREKLVDRLLASPQHTRHLAAALDVMLMERRPSDIVYAG